MAHKIGLAPDRAVIEKLATDAIDSLPPPFADHLADILVRVEDFADDEILRDMGIEDPWELTGLYQGHPLSEQSIWSAGEMPPVISLYRMPLLNEWIETGVTLEDLVVHVLIHEVGHHFGLSDADMEAIEQAVSG
ncbi:MAG: metallopeptidase family protein [Sphingobium sp.]